MTTSKRVASDRFLEYDVISLSFSMLGVKNPSREMIELARAELREQIHELKSPLNYGDRARDAYHLSRRLEKIPAIPIPVYWESFDSYLKSF